MRYKVVEPHALVLQKILRRQSDSPICHGRVRGKLEFEKFYLLIELVFLQRAAVVFADFNAAGSKVFSKISYTAHAFSKWN